MKKKISGKRGSGRNSAPFLQNPVPVYLYLFLYGSKNNLRICRLLIKECLFLRVEKEMNIFAYREYVR